MTAPGDSVLIFTLLAIFVGCSAYAAGRIHQRRQTHRDREEAYQHGYETATRNVFSLAARAMVPRRSARAAAPVPTPTVPIKAAPIKTAPNQAAPNQAASNQAPSIKAASVKGAPSPQAVSSSKVISSSRPAVANAAISFPAPPPPPPNVIPEAAAPGGLSYRPFRDPRPADGTAPRLGATHRDGPVVSYRDVSAGETESGEAAKLSQKAAGQKAAGRKASGRKAAGQRAELGEGAKPGEAGASRGKPEAGSDAVGAGGVPSQRRAENMFGPLPLDAAVVATAAAPAAVRPGGGSGFGGESGFEGESGIDGEADTEHRTDAGPVAGADLAADQKPEPTALSPEAHRFSRHDSFGVARSASAAAPRATDRVAVPAGDAVPPNDSAAGPAVVEDEEESSGRHTVPDALIKAKTYRLPPDRVFRAKVPRGGAPDESPTQAVPKPRES